MCGSSWEPRARLVRDWPKEIQASRRNCMRKGLFQWIAMVALVSLAGWFTSAKSVALAQHGAEPPRPALNAVPHGTHFLVGLDDELSTGKDKVNRKFEVRTHEPLESTNGNVIPPGARIHGHISRIEPAGTTGH